MRKLLTVDNLVRAARGLFLLNAAIWLALGVTALFRAGSSGLGAIAWIVAALMLVNATGMLGCAVIVGRPRPVHYVIAGAFLLANLVLTVTDQFGVLDLATILIDVVILGMLAGLLLGREPARES
ncbi:MAG: hypothetical protein Kow00124_16920 [Anaerolineae bacterium]